ncbi:MAG: hypothetical protein D6788_05720 [Planctomycetota bacterium]|nr:MAG: hypothetical protein D6788_05720 [Planctomycetota bacterium]
MGWTAVVSAQPGAAGTVVQVTVRGQGATADEALRNALAEVLRSAVNPPEESRLSGRDLVLVRRTVEAMADELVNDYRVLEQGSTPDGRWFTRIEARVDRSAVSDTWRRVTRARRQMGQPTIAVYIREEIDGQEQPAGILESLIEKRLLEAGFQVKAGEQLRALAERNMEAAKADDDRSRMQAIARSFGAQIFITGTAQAHAAGVKELYGEPTAMYNTNATVKMYYTDTADLLASESIPNWRGGARGYKESSVEAGKKALENAARVLADRVMRSALRKWSLHALTGGELKLEVSGLSFSEAIQLKRTMLERESKRIRGVRMSMVKDHHTFEISAEMTAEELAELLAGIKEPALQIVGLSGNTIQARKRAGP